MNDLTGILVAACTGAGLCAAGLAWWLARLADGVPPEDRRYRDPPPLALRLVWWPLRGLAPEAAA